MGNWDALRKHARAMNVSGKYFLVLLTFIETDQPEFIPGSRVTLPETFRLYVRALFNPLGREPTCL